MNVITKFNTRSIIAYIILLSFKNVYLHTLYQPMIIFFFLFFQYKNLDLSKVKTVSSNVN